MSITKIMPLFLLLFCYSCNAQKAAVDINKEKKASFPKSWIGTYEGQLNIYTVDSIKQSIKMGLEIKYINDSTYTWIIKYLLDKPDIRKYELQIVNQEKGQYQIDEKNGIILTCNLFQNKLISRFSVDQSLLTIAYEKIGDELLFEVYSGQATGQAINDLEIDNIEEIRVFQVGAYQKAKLYKKTLSN